MKKFAVIGLGRFGYSLAVALAEAGGDVIAIDKNIEPVEKLKNIVSFAVRMDSTNLQALVSQEVYKVDIAIVAVGEHFETTQLTTILLKELGVKHVISRALTDIQGKILSMIGADEVILLERDYGKQLAKRILYPSINDYLELSDGISVAEIHAPGDVIGKSIKQLDIRRKEELNIIFVKHVKVVEKANGEKEKIIKIDNFPHPDYIFQDGDVIFVAGQGSRIEKFASKHQQV